MPIQSQRDFLELLQEEAVYQSKLHKQRLLPKQLDVLAELLGRYPWQILSVGALVSAVVVQWVK